MTTPNQIEDRLAALEQRLARRERQLLRHRFVLTAAFVAAPAALLLAGADFMKFDSIQVKRLEIVNDAGEVMLAASSGASGGQLDVWNNRKNNVARLGSNAFGGDLAIWNISGNSVAGAWAAESGGTLSTWNNDGGRTARIESSDQSGRLAVYGGSDRETVLLSGDANGGQLHLRTLDGRNGFHAGMLDHGASWSLLDHTGQVAVSAESTPVGGSLQLPRSTDGSSISLDSAPGRPAIDVTAPATGTSASITNDTSAGTMLLLESESGQLRLASGATSEMPVVDLVNRRGMIAARTTLRSTGGGSCQVSSPDGEPVGILRSDLDGNGRLDMLDRSGHLLASLQTGSKAGATLALLSEFGKTVCALAGTNDGGILNLMNRTGVPVITAGSASERRGGTLSVQNERGLPVVSIGSDAGESGQVRLQGPDGSTRQVLPPRR